MKQLLLIAGLAFGLAIHAFAQQDVRKMDPRDAMMDYVPGQVLIQVADGQQIGNLNNARTSSVNSIDKVLSGYKVKSVKQVFEGAVDRSGRREYRTNAATGQQMLMPNLAKVLKVELEGEGIELRSNTLKLVEELKKDKNIVFAEPNYIFQTLIREDRGLVTPPATIASAKRAGSVAVTPNDPLYSQQLGIATHNINKVWDATGTGNGTSVIAIIDTGVDWNHPDLAANIWSNAKETGKAESHDDDNNGYTDDVRGWDFINNDNNPMDDNMHGTHVAGIAAAVGGNGVGMAGANWKAKIMPLKALQSSGRGDAATISEAIRYAYKNGATVINMSFGSYAESQVMKLALSEAYASAVLVAAAGNDGLCIGPGLCPDKRRGSPMFPGAFSFVIGVEENASGTNFSNFDQDGPVFSGYSDLFNYEVKAAGAGIVSAVPGGQYRSLSGTSMAAPLVAGAISLYKEQRAAESKELLFGNLINTANGGKIDLQAMLSSMPSPRLDFVTYRLEDVIDGDNDKRPDSNETIEIFYKVKNTWAQANKVFVSIELGEFEEEGVIEILTPETEVGSISAYAVRETAVPLKVKIAANVADGRDIVLTAKTWYVDAQGVKQGEKSQKITLTVENGVELKGIINQNLTLRPDKYYIVTENLIVSEGYTLILKPGTKLRIKDGVGIAVAGNLIAKGNPDSLIYFTKTENGLGWQGIASNENVTRSKGVECDYCVIEYGLNNNIQDFTKGQIRLSNSILRYNKYYKFGNKYWLSFDKNVITNNNVWYNAHPMTNYTQIENGKLNNNYYGNNKSWPNLPFYGFEILEKNLKNFSGNVLLDNPSISTGGSTNTFIIDPNYYGATTESVIRKRIIDFQKDYTRPALDLSNRQLVPSPEVHGFTWKVVVNGKDAQDEYEQLDALGVARHKVEVYFNRPMDKNFPPQVTMGVREPYTQTAISTDGSWNEEGTIYTVYANVGVSTGDGINRIRVAGARDLEHFEIPVEDQRFNVLVNAAGALSSGFAATPGLGKVQLDWQDPTDEEVNDLLGYNMYRYTINAEGVESEPVQINKTMVNTNAYTDFAVTPGQKYFYKYKIIRTNLTESDFSNAVATTPLTASKGDSNGDLKVSVMDVQTTVAHILGNTPEPFIFEAADVNADAKISVVDVVGTVNIVLGGTSGGARVAKHEPKMSYLNITAAGNYNLDTKEKLAALEFAVTGVSNPATINWATTWSGFEKAFRTKGDTTFVMVYSMSGKALEQGKLELFTLPEGSELLGLTLVNTQAQEMPYRINKEQKLQPTDEKKALAYPNPFEHMINLQVNLAQDAQLVEVILVNMQGQVVERIRKGAAKAGPLTLEITPRTSGLLLYTVLADKQVVANGKIVKKQ